MKKYILFACTFIIALPCKATIYAIDVLKKDGKTVYLFSDIHVETDEAVSQKNSILAWAEWLRASIIIEDAHDIGRLKEYALSQTKLCDALQAAFVNCIDTFPRDLLQLTLLAKRENLDVCNIEFRHFFKPSVAGKINFSIKDVKEVLNNVVTKNELHHPAGWNNIINEPDDRLLSQLDNEQKNLLDYVSQQLIDQLMFGAIQQKTGAIFVCAGAAHTAVVKGQLLQCGWVNICSTDNDFLKSWHASLIRSGRDYTKTLAGDGASSASTSTHGNKKKDEKHHANSIIQSALTQKSPVDIANFLQSLQPQSVVAEEVVSQTSQSFSWKNILMKALGGAAIAAVAYVAYKNNVGGWLKQKISMMQRVMRYIVRPAPLV